MESTYISEQLIETLASYVGEVYAIPASEIPGQSIAIAGLRY